MEEAVKGSETLVLVTRGVLASKLSKKAAPIARIVSDDGSDGPISLIGTRNGFRAVLLCASDETINGLKWVDTNIDLGRGGSVLRVLVVEWKAGVLLLGSFLENGLLERVLL